MGQVKKIIESLIRLRESDVAVNQSLVQSQIR